MLLGPATQVPDIELPEIDPEYWTPPTEPNWMVLPATVPEMGRGDGELETVIVPLRLAPVCVQVSLKVPDNAPL